ncbi:MAG: hypothetical protein P1S60_12145 [Anaerolineae bacterium]|nr:hypothetical protein [Anaerolineae bacterium]
MPSTRFNWLVIALSGAGVGFILLGLLALSLPTAQEGMRIVQLDSEHTLYLLDIAGGFVILFGLLLTWLGGQFWRRQLRA